MRPSAPRCFSPELNLARTRVIDYFTSQQNKQSIFDWENGAFLSEATWAWMARACTPRAFPTDDASKLLYMTSTSARMIKNFPEFACYRDISFFFKFFLNKDKAMFPPMQAYSQEDAELTFSSMGAGQSRIFHTTHKHALLPIRSDCRHHSLLFLNSTPSLITAECGKALAVKGFGRGPEPKKGLSAKPAQAGGKAPPTARFAGLAVPGSYAVPHLIETEDDVLHMAELPDFSGNPISPEVGGTKPVRALGQHDSELLLSYLTVLS